MALPTETRFLDGYYGTARLIETSPPEYPFNALGDLTTKIYRRTYIVDIDKFTPTSLGTVDPDLALHYLIAESRPQRIDGRRATFVRTYASIPSEVTDYSTIMATKPDPGLEEYPGFFGGALIVKPDATIAQYDAYAPKTVSSDSGAPSLYPTGGTYTLTLAGETTDAIAFDADASTVESALNDLTAVTDRGGCTVSGAYDQPGGFTVTFANIAAISTAVDDLTAPAPAANLTSLNGGYTQSVKITPGSVYYLGLSIDMDISSLTVSAGTKEKVVTQGPQPGNVSSFMQFGCFVNGSGSVNGGTYTITVDGQTTAAIAYNADVATVQSAVDTALTNLASHGTVVVQSAQLLNGDDLQVVLVITSAVTGGTFDITVGGDTAEDIPYNASASDIQTALNVLDSVSDRGGCTVTGNASEFTIQFATAALTGSSSSLTPAGCTIQLAVSDTYGRIQTFAIFANNPTRVIQSNEHGIQEGDAIFVLIEGSYVFLSSGFTVTTDTIIFGASSAVIALSGTITQIGKRTLQGYTPGTSRVACSLVSKFYLPGVSPGVSDPTDIPVPSAGGELAVFAAILAGSSDPIVYEVNDFVRWLGGPIYQVTATEIDPALL